MTDILITGAARGIGRALAEAYRRDGWRVIATARDAADRDALAALDGVEALAYDASDPQAADALAAALGDRPLDVVVANAGVYGPREPDWQAWLDTLAVNTLAPAMLALRLAPNLARGEARVMAVVTSRMGSIGEAGGGSLAYRSSKAAVNAAIANLGGELADHGIATVLLHPGWVRTDMGGPNASISTEQSADGLKRQIAATSPSNSGRFVAWDGTPLPW